MTEWSLLQVLTASLLVAGSAFFVGGTLGLLRFPDVFTRLHALSKADNVGLGFVVVGLATEARSIAEVAKLGMIWALVVASSGVTCQLIARTAQRDADGEDS